MPIASFPLPAITSAASVPAKSSSAAREVVVDARAPRGVTEAGVADRADFTNSS
jgi:hypothetical protein